MLFDERVRDELRGLARFQHDNPYVEFHALLEGGLVRGLDGEPIELPSCEPSVTRGYAACLLWTAHLPTLVGESRPRSHAGPVRGRVLLAEDFPMSPPVLMLDDPPDLFNPNRVSCHCRHFPYLPWIGRTCWFRQGDYDPLVMDLPWLFARKVLPIAMGREYALEYSSVPFNEQARDWFRDHDPVEEFALDDSPDSPPVRKLLEAWRISTAPRAGGRDSPPAGIEPLGDANDAAPGGPR